MNRCFSRLAIRTFTHFPGLTYIEGLAHGIPLESHGEQFAITLRPGDIGACHETSDLESQHNLNKNSKYQWKGRQIVRRLAKNTLILLGFIFLGMQFVSIAAMPTTSAPIGAHMAEVVNPQVGAILDR